MRMAIALLSIALQAVALRFLVLRCFTVYHGLSIYGLSLYEVSHAIALQAVDSFCNEQERSGMKSHASKTHLAKLTGQNPSGPSQDLSYLVVGAGEQVHVRIKFPTYVNVVACENPRTTLQAEHAEKMVRL